MEPTYPEIESIQFPICNWSEFFVEVEEAIPTNAPEATGKGVIFACILIGIMQKIIIHMDLILVLPYILILNLVS